ncbi:MAG: amidohydrolase [Chloroflexi bacterium]|nr:amidohydrolase [Chloroflexota bacterium]
MVRAIDIHIHPPMPGRRTLTDDPEIAKYFRSAVSHSTPEEMADMYAELDIFGVLFQIDFETASGSKPIPNDFIAEVVERYPKQFVGFGSVDPWKGAIAVREAERCAKELDLLGLKFHPQQQQFFPNDQRFYPLWEAAQRLGLIVLFHTGTTGVGVGQPGGGGIKLKYARPIPYIDDVAADFPELTIIMAHPSFPWQDEQLAMLVHKPNVYMDLSGWSPKYFSPLLVQYAKTLVQDKVMFGSDYPVISPERWLNDFAGLGFNEEVTQKILIDNAKRLLKLEV